MATTSPGEVAPAAVGMSADALARLDALLDSAVRAGAVPGAALAVGRHGRLVRLRGFGVLDPGHAAPATPDTPYDLASLTKVVGTTTALMQLVDEGRVSLDDPVVAYLPWWAGPHPAKARITLRQLLTHTAGLAPFRRWYLEIQGWPAYREALAAEPLEAPPGTVTRYSDLGVMTLGLVVEAVRRAPLDRVLDDRVFGPLGMADTRFTPPASAWPQTAPTEVDPAWRGIHLRGQVHDENAFAVGGVAGHAGLFSTARELARFAQAMLDGGALPVCAAAGDGRICAPEPAGGGQAGDGTGPPVASAPAGLSGDSVRLVQASTVRRFTRRQSANSTRALGWDTPGGRSSAGDYFTAAAFGHTGFTGTSLWIDPELDLFVVLLTNRVNPTRENRAHIPLRRQVHDLAARAITDRPVPPRPGSPAAEARGSTGGAR